MSSTNMTKLEINLVMFLYMLAILCITTVSLFAQQIQLDSETVEKLGGLSPSALFALIAIMSLMLSGYLIKLLFGKLMAILEENTRSNYEVVKLLRDRPCIKAKE